MRWSIVIEVEFSQEGEVSGGGLQLMRWSLVQELELNSGEAQGSDNVEEFRYGGGVS